MPDAIKINNPFTSIEGYNCFGCSPTNKSGVQMKFQKEGDHIISIWESKDHFQGYNDIIHGGIQATLLDEIAAWVVFVICESFGFTTKLDVQYHKPLKSENSPVEVKAWLLEKNRKRATIKAKLTDQEGTITTTATIEYAVLPPEVAKKRMNMPEPSEFIKV